MNDYDNADFPAFARMVIDALEAAGIEYMVGGSLTLAAWGQARYTLDIDLVAHILPAQTDRLSEELAKRDMYVPADIMRDLIMDTRSDLPINAIHGFSGYKADLFPLREGDGLRKSALERKQKVEIEGLGEVFVHSPEDVILYKIQYYAISGQDKHVRDVASILTRSKTLDREYLEGWIIRLNLEGAWKELQAAMGDLDE